MTLQRRPLGRTGIAVPPIGLGTVKLGRNTKVKYPRPFDLPDDEAVARLLDAAVAMGAALLDTAPAYGTAEQRLAPFLARRRADVVLVSKAGETYTPDPAHEDGGVSIHDFRPDAVRASVLRSLERMGVAHLDLLLLHAGNRDVEVLRTPGLRDALERLKSDGLTRAVGLSGKTDAGLRLAADMELDAVMTGFSLADPGRADALRAVHDRGLGVLAIKGLGSGHLVDPTDPDARPVTPAEAVRYVLDQPFVDSLIVGTTNPDHLQAAVDAAAGLTP